MFGEEPVVQVGIRGMGTRAPTVIVIPLYSDRGSGEYAAMARTKKSEHVVLASVIAAAGNGIRRRSAGPAE